MQSLLLFPSFSTVQLYGILAKGWGGPHNSHVLYFVLGYGKGNINMMGVGGTTGYITSRGSANSVLLHLSPATGNHILRYSLGPINRQLVCFFFRVPTYHLY